MVLVCIALLVGRILRINEQGTRLHLTVLPNKYLSSSCDARKNQRAAARKQTERQVQRGCVKVLLTRSSNIHSLCQQCAAITNTSQRRAADGQIG